MERKTLLAIILTLLVLSIYNAYVSKQAPDRFRPDHEKLTEIIENKEVKEKTKQIPSPTFPAQPASIQEAETPVIMEEKEYLLETDIYTASFSNKGAVLQSITYKPQNYTFPLTDIGTLKGFEDAMFEVEQISDGKVVFSYQAGQTLIRKTFTLGEQNPTVTTSFAITNISTTPLSLSPQLGSFTIAAAHLDEELENSRDKGLYEYAIATPQSIIRQGNAYKFSEKMTKTESGPVRWVAFRDRYFCGIVQPEFGVHQYRTQFVDQSTLSLILIPETKMLAAGETMSMSTLMYYGLQSPETLSQFGQDFEQVVAFSNWGLLNGISTGIVKIIKLLHKGIPNWGVCIIVVSILIYFSLYPLTMKGMLSMKKMQSLHPKITQLREKYKSNPQKMNMEIMELYKQHKINPLGGCFPLLLQMPVFIGLYQALWRSVVFKGQDFLWIKDLAEPDRLIYPLPFTMPFLGNEFNILPVIMMVVMFFQQKLSTKNMASTDPSQIAQQRMMGIFFPIFLGVIFYKFASGLTLYFTVFYLLSTLTQWRIGRHPQAVAQNA